jgi:hypothetical protein
MPKNRLFSGLPVLAVVVATASLLTTAACGRVPTSITPTMSDTASRVQVSETYGKLPLHFEANQGQADPQVKFLSRGAGGTVFLTSTEAVFVLTASEPREASEAPKPARTAEKQKNVKRTVLRTSLLGANHESRMVGQEELPGKANYFIGNDPAKWRTNVPTYAKVQYENVYPGIDLVYYGNRRQLEYDFVVRAGADPKTIALGFEGVDKLEVDGQGDLVLHTAAGLIRQRKPVIYQEVDGARREIAGGYVLKGERRVGFRVAAYAASRPLVIDPVLVYSTYLGSSASDAGTGIAVDADGNAYLTGSTPTSDFPTTPGAFQTTNADSSDAFVTKLNPTGSALVYSTYLGGNGDEAANGIAVDAAGNAYVTGVTVKVTGPTGNTFPTTPGGFQQGSSSGVNAFVTKLDPTGSALVYSSFLGGGADSGSGIAVDASGNAYVTGRTESTIFPTTPGAFQTTSAGLADAFVTKVDPTGSALVYSTYLGGNGVEQGLGIAVDAAGNAYVTGQTESSNFPTTPGAFQTTFGGIGDAFVTKVDPTGSALVYSTYLGGSSSCCGDAGLGIAVDATGNAYVTGSTDSTDFPTTPGAFQQTTLGVAGAGFVTKLNPTGSALVYSTYLGGNSTTSALGLGIAVDSAGNAYVAGAAGPSFPTTAGAFQPTYSGRPFQDPFVTKLDPTGSALVYSTYLGSQYNGSVAIALDTLPSPNAYVTGSTNATEFPTTPGAFQPASGGPSDAFVAKIAVNTPAGTNVSVPAGNGVTATFTAVASPGETTAATSNTGPTPPAGFTLGTPPTYYDITTTATFVPPVSVCITYDPAQFGDPISLRLLHFENNAWVDVTTSNDTGAQVICGQVSSFSLFVIAQGSGAPLTSLGPANIWVGLTNSDDVGIRFDLRAEVYRNATQLVGSGEAASVQGGSSGFNNARQDTIPLTPVGGATFQSGDTVSIKLYVRNACTGSGKNSGRARLWFNDSAANSRFNATIGDPRTYFLRDAFVLATSPGPGPKRTIDVAAGAKCSPYKTFGTWSTTVQ